MYLKKIRNTITTLLIILLMLVPELVLAYSESIIASGKNIGIELKSKGIIIEAHGYRSSAMRDLFASCHEYYKLGYSLLLIDHRTSNESEGKYITFGIKECKDIINWIKFINKKYPKSNIIFHLNYWLYP